MRSPGIPSTPTGAEQPLWSRDFILLCAMAFAVYTGFQMQVPTLPVYIENKAGAPSLVGAITGVFVLAAVAIRPWLGVQMDRRGRKGIFTVGLGVFVVATLAYNWAGTLVWLTILRIFHGLGWGAIPAGGGAMATDLIPAHRRGEGMGYYGMFTTLAMAVAPALGIWLIGAPDHPHFTPLFAVSAALAVLSALLLIGVRLPKIAPAPPKASQPVGQETTGRSENRTSGKLHRAGPGWIEKKALPASGVILFSNIGFGGLTTFVTLYALSRHVQPILAYFLVFSGALLIVRPVAGRLYDRRGPAAVLVPALVILAAGFGILAAARDLAMFLVAAALAGVGYGSVQPSLQAMAVQDVPPNRRGAANATFYTAFDLGIGIGAAGLGMMVGRFGYPSIYLASAALTLVALGIFAVSFRRSPAHHRIPQ